MWGTVSKESPTDEALMHAYARGNAASFEILYDRYERKLFSFFLRAIGDRTRAEDLLQQTFLNVHRARSRYRGGGVAAWINSIAYNLYKQECRRRSRKPEAHLSDEPLATNSDAAARTDASHELGRVWRALGQLSDAQREAVVLCRFLELDYREAAEQLGCSEDAAKLRVFRGLASLRAVLENTDSHKKTTSSQKNDEPA